MCVLQFILLTLLDSLVPRAHMLLTTLLVCTLARSGTEVTKIYQCSIFLEHVYLAPARIPPVSQNGQQPLRRSYLGLAWRDRREDHVLGTITFVTLNVECANTVPANRDR